VHQDDRHAAGRGQSGHSRVVADAPYVVQQRRAGIQRGGRDRDLGRVDADRRPGQRGGQGRHDRHDAQCLLGGIDGLVSRTCGLPADVEQVRTLVDHGAPAGDGGLDRIRCAEQAVAGEGVRGDVEDPHHPRPLAPPEGS
jgi:hypothetical protein